MGQLGPALPAILPVFHRGSLATTGQLPPTHSDSWADRLARVSAQHRRYKRASLMEE